MKLVGRTTRPEDLDQCLEILRDRFLYDDEELFDIRAMWADLLQSDVGRSAVVIDEARPNCVMAFGVSAAIGDARFESALSDGKPYIAKALLAEWRAGTNPFLDEASFASANATAGINIVVLHNGVRDTLDPALFSTGLSVLSDNFVTQHTGCNLRAALHESFGIPKSFSMETGFHVTSYASDYESIVAAQPPERQTAILSISREQAAQRPGNQILNQLFLRFSAPVCRLRPIERQLVRYALEGLSDTALAAALQIAPRTLKKRWADVYAAMEPATGIASGGTTGHRGAESRRHVLRYARDHREELHAYAARNGHATA